MLNKMLGSKALVSGIVILVSLVAGFGGAWYLRGGTQKNVTYCALMPDGIGLFEGNPVTRRGVPIGSVTSVKPDGAKARIELSVDGAERLPATVGAVTVSKSVIASRQLALVGDDNGGPILQPGKCIADTKTPTSITKSLEGVHTLASGLTTGGGPEQAVQAQQALASLARETDGSGPKINGILLQLATVLDDPGPGMADLARALDALAPLTGGMTSNWKGIQTLITELPSVLTNTLTPVGRTLTTLPDALIPTVQMLISLVGQYGHMIFPALDVAVPITRLVAGGVRDFGDLLGILPPLISAFTINFDQSTLRLNIKYTPLPDTTFSATNPDLTCSNINRLAPGQCRVAGGDKIQVDLITAILRGTGAAR